MPLPAIGTTARFCAASALAALALTGCGSEETGTGVEVPVIEGAKEGLAALYEQDQLVDSGPAGYDGQLAALEGDGAVVNIWASWCGPCREEFPYFRDLALERGDEVAFLGVNSADNHDAAATFLGSSPLPYPSFEDPDEEIRKQIAPGGNGGLPATVFYDTSGEIAYVKYGPYTDEASLAADVERYVR